MKVVITSDAGSIISEIRILPDEVSPDGEHASFDVLAYTERGYEVLGVSRRRLSNFPVKAFNPLALLRAALNVLPTEAFGAEDDDTGGTNDAKTQTPVPTDLERRLNRSVSALPSGLSGLRDYRSAVRSEQSEQHGDDSGGESQRT